MLPSFPAPDAIRKQIDPKFFDGLSTRDLRARHATNSLSYRKAYMESITPFTDAEKHQIREHVESIGRSCASFKHFVGLPWMFGKIKCCGIEQGYPHTWDIIHWRKI